jgi:hypothetical protein
MPKIGLKMRFPHRKVEYITKDLQTKYKGFTVEFWAKITRCLREKKVSF